jgi:hypothetical protein
MSMAESDAKMIDIIELAARTTAVTQPCDMSSTFRSLKALRKLVQNYC